MVGRTAPAAIDPAATRRRGGRRGAEDGPGAEERQGPPGTMGDVVRRPSPIPVVARLSIVAALSLGALGAGCGDGGDNGGTAPAVAGASATPDSIVDNPFIPEDVNIGDCVSALPRPGCGNEIRGDSHSAMTFGALVAGLAFIGWRIVRSVRRRDRAQAPGGAPAARPEPPAA
jgi:hypothetical protein